MLPVGTHIAIKVGGTFGQTATHEVTGHAAGGYLLICPIDKVGDIQPGQYWVPVTRITEDRVIIRHHLRGGEPMECPEGYTVSLTYDVTDGQITYVEVRDSANGVWVADGIREGGEFVNPSNAEEAADLPEWVGPFLATLGAPVQQGPVAQLVA